MEFAVFIASAIALAVERVCYAWAWHRTDAFREFCAFSAVAPLGDEPIDVLERLFYVFKAIQICVFVAWGLFYGHGSLWPISAELPQVLLGAAVIGVGQALNFAVFHRLGKTGVFYGNKLGYEVPWCDEFPFSVIKHPQYVGAVLTIWGVFLIMRFPHPDWVVLPLLETFYYALGARYES